jgi:hypothetical protein
MEEAMVGCRHILLNGLVEARERMIGNEREHVVLYVVVHVPV